MKENYKILGLNEDASIEEVKTAYDKLKTKYQKERFLEGEAGNDAAKMLTKIETAYREIIENQGKNNNYYGDFSDVEKELRNGNYSKAQEYLDNIMERNAEWHYLQSVVFYKKNWINESKKQLEIAIEMDPSNSKYKEAYSKLKSKVETSRAQYRSGNANYNTAVNDGQMGGDSCSSMAECCAYMCCINMLCNGCR